MRNANALNKFFCGALAILAVSCSKEPTTFSPNKVDTFLVDSEDRYTQASKLLQADYMLVLDTGFSMFDNKAVVQDSLIDFGSSLRSKKIDYRIGFVNGNIHGNGDSVSNSFIGETTLEPNLGVSLENQIAAQMFPVGMALNQHREVLLQATRSTLNANAWFTRPGSSLVVVFISDEDDESNTFFGNASEASYINFVKSKKDPSLIKGRAVVKGINPGCAVDPNRFEEAGNRLANVALGIDAIETNKLDVSRCADDNFDDILANLATDVSKPTDVFELQGTAPDTSTLKVYLNGALQTLGTHYNLENNRKVVFVTKPSASASVVLEYQPKYVLSGRPNENTITVIINGTSIARSPSDGWSYVSGENRIVFNGSAIPTTGSEVKVSYTQ